VKMTVIWDIPPCLLSDSIIRAKMDDTEATSTSETLINFYQAKRRNIPEDSNLYTRCHENLKCHKET
jgi:hypothetical protein